VRGAKDAITSQKLGTDEWASSGYDALTDSVVVQTTNQLDTARALDVTLAEAAGTATFASARDSGTLRIHEMPRGSVRKGRLNDLSPFRGGAKIETDLGFCSTGVYINSATQGTVMVTAGHCTLGNGNTIFNGNFTSQLGTTEGDQYPDPDLIVIDGKNYNPRSFAANDNTTWKEVTGSADPTTGVTYCQVGYVSKRKCYSYSALDETICDEGCTNHLARAAAGIQGGLLNQSGDSGGGVFAEKSDGTLSFRGIVIAGGCNPSSCFAWDHKRQTVRSVYDANIVVP
jgi:streptogrisin B